jgi:hypothetical protein
MNIQAGQSLALARAGLRSVTFEARMVESVRPAKKKAAEIAKSRTAHVQPGVNPITQAMSHNPCREGCVSGQS